jgi:tRNA-guanine family transglycosylase
MTVIEKSSKTTVIPRCLITRKGAIAFPAYIPVTTFGQKYPLDNLIRPYLPRLAPAVMVSHYYAKQMTSAQMPNLPMLVDSGGFAALFENAKIVKRDRLGILEIKNAETDEVEVIHPKAVLEFQEQVADVAFTLDFPIPPKLDKKEAKRRQELTIANALWAINNRRRRDLPLYACVQGWDIKSARACAKAYVGQGFEGVAIGGLVPRSQDLPLVLAIVEAVREEIGDLPLHVFGLGKPELVKELFRVGVDSVDSSSYVKYAADGKLWSNPSLTMLEPTPTDRLHLALHNLATATGATLPLAASEQLLGLFRSFR